MRPRRERLRAGGLLAGAALLAGGLMLASGTPTGAQRSEPRLSCWQEGVLIVDRAIRHVPEVAGGRTVTAEEGELLLFERAGVFCMVSGRAPDALSAHPQAGAPAPVIVGPTGRP